jgi:hypothetical protein
MPRKTMPTQIVKPTRKRRNRRRTKTKELSKPSAIQEYRNSLEEYEPGNPTLVLLKDYVEEALRQKESINEDADIESSNSASCMVIHLGSDSYEYFFFGITRRSL